jgi:hypothetical protein
MTSRILLSRSIGFNGVIFKRFPFHDRSVDDGGLMVRLKRTSQLRDVAVAAGADTTSVMPVCDVAHRFG